MRIKVNKINRNEDKDFKELQNWIEAHSDNQEGFFIAGATTLQSLVFHFVYTEMLGCHRFFIYDPIDDTILSFFSEDFTDIGRWIFNRCDEYFWDNYDILG